MGNRKKRPCRICRCWFEPHERVGDRQRVCSKPSCQRERHRRACLDWHLRNPDYDRDGRLRRRLSQHAEAVPPEQRRVDPLAQLDWSAARDAVGLEICVIVEESAKVLADWARDAVRAHWPGIMRESPKHAPPCARDEMDRRPSTA